MNWRVALISLFVIHVNSFAQSSTFARCDETDREFQIAAGGGLSKEQRLRALDQIANDIQMIVREIQAAERRSSPYPMSMLTTCRKKKVEVLAAHRKTADEPTKDSASWARVQGIIARLNAETSPRTRISDLTQAYENFDIAVTKNPNDWSSKSERLGAYIALQQARMTAGGSTGFTASDVHEYYKKTESMMEDLIKDRQVPAQIKEDALRTRAIWIQTVFPNKSDAVKDWKRLLTFSKDDQEALVHLASYYYKQQNYKDAVTYWKQLYQIKKDVPDYTEPYIDSLFQNQDFNGVILVGNEAKTILPKSSVISSRLARAFIQVGKIEEARQENKRAMKLNPKDSFTRVTESIVLEAQADQSAEQKMLSSAIQQYEAAYKLDSNRPVLRRKMSLIVFENRKNAKFEPKATAKQEMKFIAEMLNPIKARPEIGADGMSILIFAADYSGLSKILNEACLQHEKDFGPFNSAETLRICANSYAKNGNRSQAIKLLKLAIASKKFEEARPEFKALLLQIE